MTRHGTVRFERAAPVRAKASVASLLAAAGRNLMEASSAGDPMAEACRVVQALLGADLVVAFESGERDTFRTRGQYGLSQEDWAAYQTVELTGDIAGPIRARLADRSVYALNVVEPGETSDDRARRSIARKLGLGPLLVLGLRTAAVLTGLVIATRRQKRGDFSARALELAEGLCPLLAASLETDRLVRGLRAANDAQSEFLAGMSHELRTPLHVITGYVDILTDDASGQLTPQQREICDRIRASAAQQLSLVGETFEMSRRDDAGLIPVREEVMAVATFAAELERESVLRPRAAEVHVRWEVPAGGRRVVTDPLKLRMIVRNLVENALKFTRQGEVCVTLALEGDRLVCRVRDTGVGIPEAECEAVFDAFRQVGGPRSTGLGLGLYIVRRMVEALSGTVEVESRVGEGSTFTVRLPVQVVDARP